MIKSIDNSFFSCYNKKMTITQTVNIPSNRKLNLNLEIPYEIPAGKAQIELKVIPFFTKDENEPSLKCLIGVETPHADRLLGAADNLGNITLEEIREEKLAKYLK